MMAPIFIKSKEEALPDIKNWLLSAFREKKGYFVPKKEVFGAYADFCAAHHYESTTPASFGKFLKKIFPGVETRRLIRNNEQAMYYYNLTSTAAPASSRRWTSVQSSSTAPSSTCLSSSTPAHSVYTSSSSSSSSPSPQAARRRRTSSLESHQPTESRIHHHPQPQRPQLDHHHAAQQRLCRSASPSHAMFGEFATTPAHHHHHHAPSSALPAPPTFHSPVPSPSLSSSWSADARRLRSLSPTRPRRGGDEEEQGYEPHQLSSSGEAPHHIDDLVVASMRRIKEERQLSSHGVSPTPQRQLVGQYSQQEQQQQPWQYQFQHHPYYQLMSTMSGQHPGDVAAASFAAAALQLPGVAFASSSSSSSTTYDASAWAGVDYLHPLMAALPHSAMALAAAAAAASHQQHLQELQQSHHHRQQQQLESRRSSLSAVSPPMVFTTATSTTTTAATTLPSPVFARHALAPATTAHKRGRLPGGAAADAKRKRGDEDGEGEKLSSEYDDKPQPTIKDEPHDYHDSYAAASGSSSPTTNDCAAAGGRKKKSRIDFILN